jgi:hypothetical protein
MNKVLVLGNDPQINSIEFEKLPSNIITLGVNRIWLKHLPKYFFFHDYDIVEELNMSPEILANLQMKSTIFSSDWLRRDLKKKGKTIPHWLRVLDRPSPHLFPDSVTTAISIFKRQYFSNVDLTFYIAGVSLKWTEPSHFWKEIDYSNALNKSGQDWYQNRFVRIEKNFKGLKNSGIKMISVNPNSMLNKIMRYENIANLYSK